MHSSDNTSLVIFVDREKNFSLIEKLFLFFFVCFCFLPFSLEIRHISFRHSNIFPLSSKLFFAPFPLSRSEFVRSVKLPDQKYSIQPNQCSLNEFIETNVFNSSNFNEIICRYKNHQYQFDFGSFSNSTHFLALKHISNGTSAEQVEFIDLFPHSPSNLLRKFFLLTSFVIIAFGIVLLFYIKFFLKLFRLISRQSFVYSFPSEYSADVLHQLSVLNLNLSSTKQIFVFLRSIQRSKYQWGNQVFLIEIDDEILHLAILRVDLHDFSTSIHKKTSPFIICHINEIQPIVCHRGIPYGNKNEEILWPFHNVEHCRNASQWLHNTLMQIGFVYRQRYENRVQFDFAWFWTRHEWESPWIFSDTLWNFIREEENLQRLQIDRERFWETKDSPRSTASPRFIGRFRFENSKYKNICREQMAKQGHLCSICSKNIQLNENYAQWPCPSPVRHLFHFDCMVKYLRKENTCPTCQHPIESPKKIVL